MCNCDFEKEVMHSSDAYLLWNSIYIKLYNVRPLFLFITFLFTDGKPCPVCKKSIYHDQWKTSMEVREQRWAAKEAKRRELEEVVDFMS